MTDLEMQEDQLCQKIKKKVKKVKKGKKRLSFQVKKLKKTVSTFPATKGKMKKARADAEDRFHQELRRKDIEIAALHDQLLEKDNEIEALKLKINQTIEELLKWSRVLRSPQKSWILESFSL